MPRCCADRKRAIAPLGDVQERGQLSGRACLRVDRYHLPVAVAGLDQVRERNLHGSCLAPAERVEVASFVAKSARRADAHPAATDANAATQFELVLVQRELARFVQVREPSRETELLELRRSSVGLSERDARAIAEAVPGVERVAEDLVVVVAHVLVDMAEEALVVAAALAEHVPVDIVAVECRTRIKCRRDHLHQFLARVNHLIHHPFSEARFTVRMVER